MTTPKILHVTWKTRDIPDIFKDNYKEWLSFTPDYKHIIYDDNDLRNIIVNNYPQYLSMYDSFRHTIERVDFARYAILHKYGGVYADLDTIPLKKIDKYLALNKIVLGREPLEHAQQIYNRDMVLCNALMISPKNQPFWLELMENIKDNYKPFENPVNNTGPMALTEFYDDNVARGNVARGNVVVTDPCVFFPLTNTNFSDKSQLLSRTGKVFEHVSQHCDINDAYVAHVWQNTWIEPFTTRVFKNPKNWILFSLVILFLIIIIFL